MNPKDRRDAILRRLKQTASAVTAAQLAKEFGVTSRTVYEDVAVLRREGHEISGTRARRGGLRIERALDSRRLDPTNRLPAPRFRYIGQCDLIDHLNANLALALSGVFRSTLLYGDPGSGKTRTADEVAQLAVRLGFMVCRGKSQDAIGHPGLWPWTHVFRDVYAHSPEVVERLPERAGHNLFARFIPEAAVDDPVPVAEDLDADRPVFQLHDAVTRFLADLASRNPILIVLDDLQWADSATIDLLRFLVDEAPASRLVVIGCYRQTEVFPGHPLGDAIAKMHRHEHFSTRYVEPLIPAEMRSLIENRFPDQTGGKNLETIVEQASGNPFFAIHLFESELTRSSAGRSDTYTVPSNLPMAIRDSVDDRVRRLGSQSLAVLQVAATVGKDFELPVVRRALGSADPSDVLTTLDVAISAGLVETTVNPGRYTFTHDLIRGAILDGIEASLVPHLNSVVARALESEFKGAADQVASRIAAHYGQARAITGSEPYATYSLHAGQEALKTLAYDEARRHFEAALTTKEPTGQSSVASHEDLVRRIAARARSGDGDVETAEILYGLMRAYLGVDRGAEAPACQEAAFRLFVQFGKPERALSVATFGLSFSYGSAPFGRVIHEAMQLETSSRQSKARLLSDYALHLASTEIWQWASGPGIQTTADFRASRRASQEALRISRELGDLTLESRVTARIVLVENMAANFRCAAAYARRCETLAYRVETPAAEGRAHKWLAITSAECGNLSLSSPHAQMALSAAERGRSQFDINRSLLLLCQVGALAGDWQRVHDSANRLSDGDAPLLLKSMARQFQILAALETGVDAGDADSSIAELEGLYPMVDRFTVQSCGILSLILRIASLTGRGNLVQHQAAGDDTDPGPWRGPPIVRLFRLAIRGARAVADSDTCVASDTLRALRDFSQSAEHGHPHGCVSRLMGQLSVLVGENQAAESHFKDAIDWFDNGASLPDLAWTCHDYAQYLLQRPGRPNRVVLDSALKRANTISVNLGMNALRTRVEALQSRLNARSGPGAGHPFGLSNREVEVLRLIAAGKSNREIADLLVISHDTAARHVTHVLQKSGAVSRAEAAALAVKHDLT